MATLAAAGALAAHLGLSLTDPPTTTEGDPLTAPCRCLDARGKHDPRVWASLPDRCERCGRWLPWTIGTEYDEFDLDGLAQLHLDVLAEQDRTRTRWRRTPFAGDYEAWLLAELAQTEKSLERMCRPLEMAT